MLTYCVDPCDPSSPLEQEIADVIAGALLADPAPVVIPNQSVQQELDDL